LFWFGVENYVSILLFVFYLKIFLFISLCYLFPDVVLLRLMATRLLKQQADKQELYYLIVLLYFFFWFSPFNFLYNLLHLPSRLSSYISKFYFPVTKINESVQSAYLKITANYVTIQRTLQCGQTQHPNYTH